MKYEPKQHQKIAERFLVEHKRAALFLDMGLGKTVITLTRIKELIDDFAINKVLVIAPKRVAEDTWSREQSKWDHLKDLRISKVLGSNAVRTKALEADADVYVTNRENVVWLVELLGASWPFDMVVIDELSSFKSTQAKRWRALKRVIKLSDYVIGLTGTPAPNGYEDLYAQMYLIDGGEALGKTLGAYRQKYFTAGAHKGHVVYDWRLNHGSKEVIDRKLAGFCLSMTKEDWLSLPPIIFNNVEVRMDDDERELYDTLLHERVLPIFKGKLSELGDMDSAVVGTTAATLSGKLLQMSNGAVYDDSDGVAHIHDKKLEALEEIEEGSAGQSLLVFYNYKHDVDRILSRFPKARVLNDASDISAWNRGEIPMLLCHPASAGYGLNLQEGGHIVVWFGLPWSLENYIQANARVHRQGQEQRVIVHHIICEDTLDQRVLETLQRKDATQKSLLDALKGFINESES